MFNFKERAVYKNLLTITLFLLAAFSNTAKAQIANTLSVDICIYGGTSSGVIAAYTAAKMGKKVILVEPGRHLGGMTSGGLGYTDIGNKYVVTGLARDFYRRVGAHYGKFEQWVFEPKVAEAIFNDYVKRGQFGVLADSRIIATAKAGNLIKEITVENTLLPQRATNQKIKAKIFIDCSYEGDLMARAGVTYVVGREANSEFKETIDGVNMTNGHQIPDGIDPYIIRGDPTSGLLWGITANKPEDKGSGDKKVQAYNFRITLTNVPENRIPITRPDNYDPKKYELLVRIKEKQPWKALSDIFIWSRMPNGKTDINNKGGFSTDMIGMNWDYPEAGYAKRDEIWKAHTDYTKGLLYFVGHDPRVPEHIRNEMSQWGYPKDEYTDNGNWTTQLYVREARRMRGELVMTQDYCQSRQIADDGIAMAAYTMDSHNCQRVVINGMAKNEGNVEVGGFGPYPISYRAIVPQAKDAVNLLVPVCLSATHIAYGSIRMEPVFMVLGQASAVAACQAIDLKQPVQLLNVKKIQATLKEHPLADNSTNEILVDNSDSAHVQLTGHWHLATSGGYGRDYLTDTTHDGSRSVRFVPAIIKNASYHVYIYLPKVKNASRCMFINLYDGKNLVEKVFNPNDISVVGQTSGEWVSFGTYSLNAGKKCYLEVTNKNADGVTAADAVLFVPVTP